MSTVKHEKDEAIASKFLDATVLYTKRSVLHDEVEAGLLRGKFLED
jgi:hypothetical protein